MRCWLFLIIGFLLSGESWAQAAFSEGILIYRIDSVQRLQPKPALKRAVQFKLYKKADFIRAETLYRNVFDSTDWQRMIEIRNQEGIYTIIETKPLIPVDDLAKELAMSKDSLLKVMPWLNDFALFSTYEEEKRSWATAALRGKLKTYTVKKTGKKSRFLFMPTEKFLLMGSDKNDTLAVQVTQDIQIPLGVYFEPLRKIDGTPLQFTTAQDGWLNRYTIESIQAQSLPDELFRIDPKRRVMTTHQMLQEAGNLTK